MTLLDGGDGLQVGEVGRHGQVRWLERRVGDANADNAAVKQTGRAGEGGAEGARALSQERATLVRTGWLREGRAERADTNEEGIAVKQTG